VKRRQLLALAGLIALGACAGVLGLRTRNTQAFAHRAHVLAGVSCLTCHDEVSRAGDDDPVLLPNTELCISCHTKPHDERPCLTCHTEPWAAGAAVEARLHLKFSHAQHVPVLEGNCARCHQDVARTDGPIRPRMATCLGCHEHQDGLDPDRCDTCHVDLEGERTIPESHLVHDGDWMRSHGASAGTDAATCASCHTESFCTGCHGVTAPAVPAQLQFDLPDGMMLHRAGFRARHAEEAHADPGSCSSCHTESACRDCHQRAELTSIDGEALSPHPPGWVGLALGENEHGAAARRDPAACASCHGGAGEQLCVDCHREGGVGGSIHPPGWSSAQPKSALPCRLCHQ
jgi:hypothetical protein